MGTRFRKSFKIAPGVRVNLGKKSSSVSFGSKGARHTISSTGRRTTTVGIPGTGISYTKNHSNNKTSNRSGFDMDFTNSDDYSEFVNPDYQSILSLKDYNFYEKYTKNGFLFDEDPSSILTQSGKKTRIFTYKFCYYFIILVSLFLFLLALIGFTESIPTALVFIICSLAVYFPFKDYRRIISVHRQIFDFKKNK